MASEAGKFLLGIGLGTGVMVVMFLAAGIRPWQPSVEPAAEPWRDELDEILSSPAERGRRALPSNVRFRRCEFVDVVKKAMDASVPRPGEHRSMGDFETPELRLEALLGAAECVLVGDTTRLEARVLGELEPLISSVARKAERDQGPAARRAWLIRSWAFGQDLLAMDPVRFGAVGSAIMRDASEGVLASIQEHVTPPRELDELSVMVETLASASVDVSWLIKQHLLSDLKALRDIDVPSGGPKLPAVLGSWTSFSASGGQFDASLDLPSSTETSMQGAAEIVRNLVQHDRAVQVLTLLVHGSRDCTTPWTGAPPTDVRSGLAFEWADCRLTAGSKSWEIAR